MRATAPEIKDEELIAKALDGDSSAFESLVQRYQDTIYRLAYRMVGSHEDAQDLSQECFVRLYRVLPKYKQGLPFAPWLYRICTNLCINWLQRRSRRVPTQSMTGTEEWADQWDMPDLEPGPEELVSTKEERLRVMEAVGELPLQLRLPLVLRFLLDLTFREISEILGLPLGTVATRVRRATEMLRKSMHASEGEQTK
jgi:RNA polymerase sigma-70 factor (ECF subfamily)